MHYLCYAGTVIIAKRRKQGTYIQGGPECYLLAPSPIDNTDRGSFPVRAYRWVQALSSPLGKARHGQAKVGKADVPVAADEEVVWLDVAVNDAHRVDVLQRQHRLRDVLPRRVLLKAAHALRAHSSAALPLNAHSQAKS